MKDSVWLMLLLQAVLIALNAVFASAEIAVLSVNEIKLDKMVEQGNKRAKSLKKLTSQPARFLATIQVAITLSGFLGSAFAAENFSDGLVKWLVGLGVNIPESTLNAIAVILITLILSYFTLIFGELVPKRVAMRKAEALALGISPLVTGISKLFAPLVWLLTVSTNFVLKLMGIDPNAEEEHVDEEDIRMMVDAGSEKGTIDVQEKEFIRNVFEFDDMTAGQIATHRTDVALLWLEESEQQWHETICSSRHTLYPVCSETADNVVGILNAKDYFRLDDRSRENVLKNAVRPAYFVPESVKADVLFRNMRKTRNKLAVVMDEYGGVSGIVTVTDLMEQLVGELNDDETTTAEPPDIEKLDSGTWKISGQAPLEEVAEALNVPLPTDEYETFNGLVFNALGAIPEDGSDFETETNGLHIKVTKVHEHQIESAIVCPIAPQQPEQPAEEE